MMEDLFKERKEKLNLFKALLPKQKKRQSLLKIMCPKGCIPNVRIVSGICSVNR